MSKVTYVFNESGVIPGIPREQGGEGHAGQEIDVNTETNTVVATRLTGGQEMPSGQPLSVRIQTMDGQQRESGTVDEFLQPATENYTTQPLGEEQSMTSEQVPFPDEIAQPVVGAEQPVEGTNA